MHLATDTKWILLAKTVIKTMCSIIENCARWLIIIISLNDCTAQLEVFGVCQKKKVNKNMQKKELQAVSYFLKFYISFTIYMTQG